MHSDDAVRARPVALTIAGSDSGGGAGIQADLRVFHRLGAFGTSAVTAVTAQNLQGVTAVAGLDPAIVRAQIEAVLGGFEVGAIKTGMLWSAAIVETVAGALAGSGIPLVVDPVLVATSGALLLQPDAIASYRTHLIPHAALVTPNFDEAAVLLQCERIDENRQREAAAELADTLGVPVLLKGGHATADPLDVLVAGGRSHAWRHPRLRGVNSHGSGCMLAAAIAALVATGAPLVDAVEQALAFVHDALVKTCVPTGAEPLADVERAVVDRAALTSIGQP